MTHWAAVGFTATVSLLIPAAWHTTAADLPADGALVKPPTESFKVNGAEVKVEVDRGAVAAGGEVHVKLYAISDKPQRLSLSVQEQTTSSMPGDRVERAPDVLSRRTVHLVAGPDGGKPQELAFHLPAAKGKKGGVRQYSFLVQPSKPSGDDDDGEQAALVSVITHDPEAYSVTIEPPAHVTPGEPFELTVRVKNPGQKAIHAVHVDLTPAPEVIYANLGPSQSPVYGSNPGAEEADTLTVKATAGGEEDAITIDALAPGEEKVVMYKVAPGKPLPRYAFMASAWSRDAGNALDWKSVDAPAPVAAK
jgi:hypothetical protein